jgi:hypothetical protein
MKGDGNCQIKTNGYDILKQKRIFNSQFFFPFGEIFVMYVEGTLYPSISLWREIMPTCCRCENPPTIEE